MADATDLGFMARALRLAERGRYTVHPNPTVGCVLVRQGKIVGEGWHIRAGEGHAEANALADAGGEAAGATAYVTLEPCSFRGRTPSCASSLVEAGVRRVVVATLDPDPRNAGAGIGILKEAGIEVELPLLENSARQLVRGQMLRYESHRPHVRLKLAMSLDGKTALANGSSKWVTSPEARRDVQRLRAASGAVVTGVQTIIDDDPLLTVRAEALAEPDGELAARIPRPVYVLDSNGRVPENARVLSRDDTVLVTCSGATVSVPVETVVLPDKGGRVALDAVLALLAEREHNDVLFECGPTLAGSLVSERLVDELIVYLAPSVMGADARSLLNLPELVRMSDLVDLDIQDIRPVGRDFRITARLAKERITT